MVEKKKHEKETVVVSWSCCDEDALEPSSLMIRGGMKRNPRNEVSVHPARASSVFQHNTTEHVLEINGRRLVGTTLLKRYHVLVADG
jgi:hypothetical protein